MVNYENQREQDERILRTEKRFWLWAAAPLYLYLIGMFVIGLIDVLLYADRYPFGAENCGWAYRDLQNYLTKIIVILGLLTLGVLSLILFHRYWIRIVLGWGIPSLVLVMALSAGC